jgi:hypothetical protein
MITETMYILKYEENVAFALLKAFLGNVPYYRSPGF